MHPPWPVQYALSLSLSSFRNMTQHCDLRQINELENPAVQGSSVVWSVWENKYSNQFQLGMLVVVVGFCLSLFLFFFASLYLQGHGRRWQLLCATICLPSVVLPGVDCCHQLLDFWFTPSGSGLSGAKMPTGWDNVQLALCLFLVLQEWRQSQRAMLCVWHLYFYWEVIQAFLEDEIILMVDEIEARQHIISSIQSTIQWADNEQHGSASLVSWRTWHRQTELWLTWKINGLT